eukprot:1161949-Pelagomonas_calceolata.AAC.5
MAVRTDSATDDFGWRACLLPFSQGVCSTVCPDNHVSLRPCIPLASLGQKRVADKGGGTCTFCGRKVALNYRGHGDDEASDTVAASQAGPGAPASDQQAGSITSNDAATAAAIAFKNRLVDYDRNRWGCWVHNPMHAPVLDIGGPVRAGQSTKMTDQHNMSRDASCERQG